MDEMFPEGAGPYVDLDEVGRFRERERGVGVGAVPASKRRSPRLRGFKNCKRLGKRELAGPKIVLT